MAMKSVTLTDDTVVACNQSRRGVFTLGADSTWIQHKGTAQTPTFRDAAHLVRWVRAHLFSNCNADGTWPAVRRGTARCWND